MTGSHVTERVAAEAGHELLWDMAAVSWCMGGLAVGNVRFDPPCEVDVWSTFGHQRGDG